MRRLGSVLPLVLVGLLAACGDERPLPTQPSSPANTVPPPAPTPSGQAVLSGCRVDGPASIAPGESAQYRAIGSYSDGSIRDLTTEVPWSSTDDALLSVTAQGLATGRAIGDVDVQATFAGNCVTGRQVVVLPPGRFLVWANVTEEQVTAPILGVRVEVISGPAAGLTAMTNWDGGAKLIGVPQDAELRFSKDGYEPIVRSVRIERQRQSVGVQMLASTARLDLSGKYQLSINSGRCDGGETFPEAAKARTYTARMWNAGLKIQVELSGASFTLDRCLMPGMSRCQAPTGNVFSGQTQARDARFTLVEYRPAFDWNDGIYPDLVESVPGVGLLSISGNAVVAPTREGFTGTLDGTFAIYDHLSVHTTNGQGRVLASCRSAEHRFTLVR